MSLLEVQPEIPSHPQGARDCGAACLSMVYRSLGKDVTPAEIWPRIAKENHLRSLASTTHLMVQDALNRGFAAVAFQARDPLLSLRRCHEAGIHAILNYRLRPDVPTGHYGVLAGIDSKNVVLHDPSFGPSLSMSHAELLELWEPNFPDAEIAGHILIGIAAQPAGAPACYLCHTPIPSSVECPRCAQAVGLEPNLLLSCVNGACIARAWNYVCCPSCDFTWNLASPPQPAPAAASSPVSTPSQSDPRPAAGTAGELDVNKLFGELDKFTAYLLAIPGVASHPDIRKQLDFINKCKKEFKPAFAELLAKRDAGRAQLEALVKAEKEKGEALLKQQMQGKVAEPSSPSPPLDAQALGRALLKNLGWES